MRRKLAAGNWKMNGTESALVQAKALAAAFPAPQCDIVLCPPFTLLREMAVLCDGAAVAVGGQDCHEQLSGAYTGDISARMLADGGAHYVIVGHSERRDMHHETDAQVAAKTKAAWAAGLTAIVCIGESAAQRAEGKTLEVIGAQMQASIPDGAKGGILVVAYEPIWAIGSGQTPTNAEIAEVHAFMRRQLEQRFGARIANAVRLLYGGSMTPANATEIAQIDNVDGGLVGGASLLAKDFIQIVGALNKLPEAG